MKSSRHYPSLSFIQKEISVCKKRFNDPKQNKESIQKDLNDLYKDLAEYKAQK